MTRSNTTAVAFDPVRMPCLDTAPRLAGLEAVRASLPAADQPDITEDEDYATQLRELIPSLSIYMTLGRVLKEMPPLACKIFRDRLIQDCGSPGDPIEVMLIEQLSAAHLNMALLNHKAAAADSVEAATAYWSASARLMGEFRRTALALKAYRAG